MKKSNRIIQTNLEETTDKENQIEEYNKNNGYNNLRLNIAKELLIAQLSNSHIVEHNNLIFDLVDDSVEMADMLIEKVNE